MNELTIDHPLLMQTISIAIMDGIRDGVDSTRRRVLFKKWVKTPKDELVFGKVFGSYDWSKDWYDGILLDLHSTISVDEEIFTTAIVQQLDGTIQAINIDKVKILV